MLCTRARERNVYIIYLICIFIIIIFFFIDFEILISNVNI